MADVDTDPFGEQKSRPEEPTDENVPLDWLPQEDQLSWVLRSHGNLNDVNKKHHWGEEKVKEIDC